MPIVESDVQYRLSGGAGNSDPNLSLGGVMSSTAIVSATLHNLFDAVSSAERSAGDTEYRGFYALQNHASITGTAVVVWIEGETAGGATAAIALAAEAVNVTMATIANESTAPASVTFSAPTTKATGLSIGSVPAGQFKGIWVRRTVPVNADVLSADTVQIRIEGDTVA